MRNKCWKASGDIGDQYYAKKTLKSLIAFGEAEFAAWGAHADSFERPVRIGEERGLQMSENIVEHGSKFCAALAARSSAEVVLRFAESQLYAVCACASSLREEVTWIKSDNPSSKEHWELEARHYGRTHDWMDSTSDTNRDWLEKSRNSKGSI